MAIAQDPFSNLLWNVGYAICHQLPERSFFFGGFQMPICARDTGTFLGFLIVFVYWLGMKRYRRGSRPDQVVLAFAVVGMFLFAFDGLSSYLEFYATNNSNRLFTGFLMGATIGLLLLSVFPLVAFEKTIAKRVFTWHDLIPLYLIIAVSGLIILSFDFGIPMFYALESLVMAGFFIALFIALLGLTYAIVKDREYFRSKLRIFYYLIAFILEIALISTMWCIHNLMSISFN